MNPEYIPPEIVTGENYQPETDWWCLGIMMWELFVGKSPFFSETFHEMSYKILSQELTFPGTMSPELKSLIEKLLHRDISKRLNQVQDIKNHSFFSGVDWSVSSKKKQKTPFKSLILSKESNFDSLRVEAGLAETMVAQPKKAKFSGHSFVEP
eukprot:TRINITY_DN8978_c0_g1_i1.p1 TRINITY_DN8978_c0_g1~~TRINITY_DN8978_c0_g1_i1.p1  ORF type:complete len:153 (-),score=19.85 TRINITY_DN8978_c0_g1_i1:61-519(-)